VYLTTTFEPEVGGTVRQIGNQARELAASGYDATVLTARSRAALQRSEERDGILVHRFASIPGPAGQALLILQWSWWLLLNRRRVAVVQAVMHPEFLCCAAFAGLLARSTMLWVTDGDAERNLAPNRHPVGLLIRAARRRLVKAVPNIVLTPAMREEVSPYATAAPIVIPVPVDCGHFRAPTEAERQDARERLQLDDDEVALLYVGHVEPRKGLHNLLQALGSISGARVRLFVVALPGRPNTSRT